MCAARSSVQLELFGAPPEATFSDCGRYRYTLSRIWGGHHDRRRKVANFIMLNPSTATETDNDPTVWRCMQRAKQMGFDAMLVTNLFGYRATDPADMLAQEDPVGAGNDQAILDCARSSDIVICAWGVHGAHMDRDLFVLEMLAANGIELYALEFTRDGFPRHPLYLRYSDAPKVWCPDVAAMLASRG